ncbi:MAG: hypothetical protein NTY30_01630 [Candidatus Berkelbacteria bacterium]|nr:hypothetical protein [Candidatus Berkelbacteria bacterium]
MSRKLYPPGRYVASEDGCALRQGDPILDRQGEFWIIYKAELEPLQNAIHRFMCLPDDFVISMLPGYPRGVSIGTIRRESLHRPCHPILSPGIEPGCLKHFGKLLPLDLEASAQTWIMDFLRLHQLLPADHEWVSTTPDITDQHNKLVTFVCHPKRQANDIRQITIVMQKTDKNPQWNPVRLTMDGAVWTPTDQEGTETKIWVSET